MFSLFPKHEFSNWFLQVLFGQFSGGGKTRAARLMASTKCVCVRFTIYNRMWTMSFIKIIQQKSPNAWWKRFRFCHDISTFSNFILSFQYRAKILRDPKMTHHMKWIVYIRMANVKHVLIFIVSGLAKEAFRIWYSKWRQKTRCLVFFRSCDIRVSLFGECILSAVDSSIKSLTTQDVYMLHSRLIFRFR